MKQAAMNHRKMKRLARFLDEPIVMARGIMATLWKLAVDQFPDGDLTDLTPEEFAEECGLLADRGIEIFDAMKDAGFIDAHPAGGSVVIHDWLVHCETYAISKLKDTNRLPQNWRRVDGAPDGFYQGFRTTCKDLQEVAPPMPSPAQPPHAAPCHAAPSGADSSGAQTGLAGETHATADGVGLGRGSTGNLDARLLDVGLDDDARSMVRRVFTPSRIRAVLNWIGEQRKRKPVKNPAGLLVHTLYKKSKASDFTFDGNFLRRAGKLPAPQIGTCSVGSVIAKIGEEH